MKRKIALLLLFALMLVSCGSNPGPSVPTYTITIKETSHFTPSKDTFTFKENDFSPITFSYTTDKYFNLTSIESESDECECSFEDDEQTITITPKANTNIEITPTLHRLEGTISIQIMGNDYFTPSIPEIVVLKDDFKEKYVKYAISKNYYVSSISVEPSGAAECSVYEAKKELKITPKQNTDCVISVECDCLSKMVTFNPGEGGELGKDAETSIEMYYGTKWCDCFDSNKQVATYQGYDFLGWSTAAGGHGELIDPNCVIGDETPAIVYASYAHNINMTSASLEVKSIDYSNSETRLMLNLKDSKYEFPADESAFNITDSSGGTVDFSYEDDSGEKYIKLSDPTQVEDGIINIVVTDYQPEYSMTSSFDVNLQVVGELPGSVKKGEDITFGLHAVNTTNDSKYYIPYELKITIGSSETPLRYGAYRIEADSALRQNATVTIFGRYVLGDVNIEGAAAQFGYYFYKINKYGVPDPVNESADEGIHDASTTLELEYGSQFVWGDNVAIQINGTEWYSFINLPDLYKSFIHLSHDSQKITIDPDVNSVLSTIVFYVVRDGYESLFAEASWELINFISTSEYVQKFFKVGQTRNIQVGNLNYEIRIIDLNHDSMADEDKKAGLTIEFSNVICNDDGTAYKDKFSDYFVGNYNNETYDNYLSNDFFEKLPTDLSDYIKTVKKRVCEINPGDDKNIRAKVFALSYEELGLSNSEREHKEGTAYTYYKDADDNKRIKNNLNSEATGYWTRSISQGASNSESVYIKNDGNSNLDEKIDDHAYMAAFCI